VSTEFEKLLKVFFSNANPLTDLFPGVQLDRQNEDDLHSSHCCLVAIGRLQVTSTANSADLNGSNNQSEFISRHSMDGKFSFVDQRVMNVLGYVPTDLLGKSCYDFFHPEDQNHMKENFDQGKFKHMPHTTLNAHLNERILFSLETKRTNVFRHVSLPSKKSRMDLATHTGLCFPQSLQRRSGIHCLHKQFCKVRSNYSSCVI
jgi:PAS domain-containing protein